MAGMPYPNPTDPELKERMRYMEADGKDWGQMYYEDLCFKVCHLVLHCLLMKEIFLWFVKCRME